MPARRRADATRNEIAAQLNLYPGLTLDNIRIEAELLDQARAGSGLAPYVTDGQDDRLATIFLLASLSNDNLGNTYNNIFNYHATTADPIPDNNSEQVLTPDLFRYDDYDDNRSVYSWASDDTLV